MLKEMIDTVKKAEADAEDRINRAKLEASAEREKIISDALEAAKSEADKIKAAAAGRQAEIDALLLDILF